MRIERIKTDQAKPFILKKHYAKRMPSVSYAFGLVTDDGLIGICTYGTPASSSLRVGVCGEDYSDYVLELNRLCVNENAPKNSASFLVGNSLKMIGDKIVVSYADVSQNHIGYIYQATNFIYTGLSAKRTDWCIKGMEHLHGQTIADISRGKENRVEYMREKYGDKFSLKDRPRKHRYIFIAGNKKFKKIAKQNIIYNIEEYPKGESIKYDCIDIPAKTTLMDFLHD